MSNVSFDMTDAEMELIERIADRAQEAGLCRGERKPRHWYERLTLIMDLAATNANGCPMDFERMLAADDFNFLHDIAGIARHINRRTGLMDHRFLPRFARTERAA